MALGEYAPLQVVVITKSDGLAPARVTDEMCNAVVPLLVSVTVCNALATPCVVAGKETVEELKLTADCEAIPVPDSEIFCGELGASSLMVMVAVREPAPSGVNVTSMVQVWFGANAPLQELVMLKSEGFEPPRRTEEMCSVAEPALVRVTV